jgi:hypothetical protein
VGSKTFSWWVWLKYPDRNSASVPPYELFQNPGKEKNRDRDRETRDRVRERKLEMGVSRDQGGVAHSCHHSSC